MENIKETINLKIQAEGNELTIRHGEAPELREPETLRLEGTIHSPKEFFEKRKEFINVNSTHLIYSKNKRFMRLVCMERSHNPVVVEGSLHYTKELENFKINAEKYYTPKELAKLLKQNRRFFFSQDENNEIVTALNSFSANINTNVEKQQDQRGNSKNLLQRSIQSNVPLEFMLGLPIFVGEEQEYFKVEICIDAEHGLPQLWLESIELIDAIDSIIKKLIGESVEFFSKHIVVIEQ